MAGPFTVPDSPPALLYRVVDRLTSVKGRIYLLRTRLSGAALPAAEVDDHLATIDRDVDAVVMILRRLEYAAAAELVGLQEHAAADVADMQRETAARVALQQEESAAELKRRQEIAAEGVRELHDRTAAARHLSERGDPPTD